MKAARARVCVVERSKVRSANVLGEGIAPTLLVDAASVCTIVLTVTTDEDVEGVGYAWAMEQGERG